MNPRVSTGSQGGFLSYFITTQTCEDSDREVSPVTEAGDGFLDALTLELNLEELEEFRRRSRWGRVPRQQEERSQSVEVRSECVKIDRQEGHRQWMGRVGGEEGEMKGHTQSLSPGPCSYVTSSNLVTAPPHWPAPGT